MLELFFGPWWILTTNEHEGSQLKVKNSGVEAKSQETEEVCKFMEKSRWGETPSSPKFARTEAGHALERRRRGIFVESNPM